MRGCSVVDAAALLSASVRAFLVVLFAVQALPAQALTFPPLTGRVVDEAGILDPATKSALERKLADFEARTTGQLVVVTLKSLEGTSIEDYGYQLGRFWKIGQKEKNSGVLLIVAPNERKVRIEVGYGLEGQLTDAVSRLIIENAILPRFKANDMAGGITRGVDDIIQALADPEEWRARANQRSDDVPDAMNVMLILLFLLVVFVILRQIYQQGRGYPQVRGRGRRSGGPIFVPVPGSWSSGGGGGWSGSSGGFSGGGGSFGGGGASGSW
jgi:uncharacterized protein